MKGIYLTPEAKSEIEAIITELESWGIITELHPRYAVWKIYKEILSSATILPIEESWSDIQDTVVSRKQLPFSYTEEYYPNGVIIQPKQ